MAVFGFVTVLLWIGPLMDLSTVFLMLSRFTWSAILTIFLSGFYMNLIQALCTAAVLLLLGNALLEKLDRVKRKYGMLDRS